MPQIQRLMPALLISILASTTLFAVQRHPSYEPNGKPAGSMSTAVGGPKNLFLNATVTASGQWSDRKPQFAVDGERNNAGNHWACEKLPATLTLDMGKSQRLSTITVVPYWPDGRIYTFTVEGSADGKTWTILADQSANSINSGSAGFDLSFEPVSARYVRINVKSNSANSGAHIVEIEGYGAKKGSASLACGDLYARYDRDVPANPATLTNKVELRGWRGERVNALLVASSSSGFDELTVTSKNKTAELNIIRYTLGNGTLYGDILDGTEQTKFKGVTRPILYSYDIPVKAKGVIRDVVAVRINGTLCTVPVTITVVPKTLPPPKEWAFHLDLWQHPDAIARWHDVPAWSDEHFMFMKPYHQILANMGQKVITATLIDEAWGEQTYDRFRSMVTVTKRRDGTWSYDYSAFDAYVSSLMALGINKQIHCYTLIPWSLTFPYFDEASGRIVRPKMNPDSPAYEAFWSTFLQSFVKHLKQKNWLEKTKLAMDERPDHLLKPALALAKKYAPELGFVAACNHPSKMNEWMDDVSYAYGHCEKVVPVAAERRAQGKTTTFYVCCSPNRPNTFMFSDPAEAEWMPLMAVRYGLDGFLRWAWSSWVENPLVSNDYTSWPTGDTSLIYPGPRKSLRAEHLRDGIETAEKIRLLKTKPAALNTLTVARGAQAGVHAEDVRAVNEEVNR